MSPRKEDIYDRPPSLPDPKWKIILALVVLVVIVIVLVVIIVRVTGTYQPMLLSVMTITPCADAKSIC